MSFQHATVDVPTALLLPQPTSFPAKAAIATTGSLNSQTLPVTVSISTSYKFMSSSFSGSYNFLKIFDLRTIKVVKKSYIF